MGVIMLLRVKRLSRTIGMAACLVPALSRGQSQPAYKNPALPMEQRVDDLVSRMTLEEKIAQLQNDSVAIERLGIPAYNWWNEALHGVARAGRATVFPQAIGLAATWDTDLMFRVATAISDEARAKNNEFLRLDKHNIYQGLTFWTPNINLFRDPRWGRGMETYGEDPFLTGRMGVSFIKGMQGDDPRYLKTVATAKHYAVHSGPESSRHTFDVKVDEQDLRTTYLPQFEAAVREGGASSVMCAYNRVDGQPACANTKLLDDILRKEWGFNGYVVSDCGAIGDIYRTHKFSPNAEQGVAVALKAGTDLSCGGEYAHLAEAVKSGLVSETEINTSVKRLFLARFKLGLFDPPAMVKYAQIPYRENDSSTHRQLALEAARKTIVLLKNENHVLPLSKNLKTVAVIGPDADDVDTLLGNYNGIPTAPVTPLEGIRKKLGSKARVLYARGTELAANLPHFETVPASALFTSNTADRKNGLRAEYFNSADFDGKPHRPRERNTPQETQPVFTRVDAQVDFHWWENSPRKDLNDDDFGVRWTGYLSAPTTGTYQLGAIGMNAFELYLDGKQIVRYNNIHESSYTYAPVEMEAGKLYAIRLDYHEFVNDASIRLVWAHGSPNLEQEALEAAKQADAVVLMMGLSPRLEGEEMKVPVEGFQGGDRLTLNIPAVQQDLMEKIAALSKPTVLVLMNGSALGITWARDHMPAIVEAWYGGQAGGTAIADVLFGDYNPAGRLPVTFYASVDQLPPFSDYSMKGRTYRYFDGEPVFPFGYGLSYTTFGYSNLQVPKQVKRGESVTVSVEVDNTGKAAGEEVVELYTREPSAAWPTPRIALAGLQRISLRPKEKRKVQFTLKANQLPQTSRQIEITVGGKQPGPQGTDTAVVSGTLQLSQ